jgi:hypothetical protein
MRNRTCCAIVQRDASRSYCGDAVADCPLSRPITSCPMRREDKIGCLFTLVLGRTRPGGGQAQGSGKGVRPSCAAHGYRDLLELGLGRPHIPQANSTKWPDLYLLALALSAAALGPLFLSRGTHYQAQKW